VSAINDRAPDKGPLAELKMVVLTGAAGDQAIVRLNAVGVDAVILGKITTALDAAMTDAFYRLTGRHVTVGEARDVCLAAAYAAQSMPQFDRDMAADPAAHERIRRELDARRARHQ
jgi:hypothetical protein